MKFTEGFWRMRDDVRAVFAAEARSISIAPRDDGIPAITVFAPTKAIAHRGDTLNIASLTVTLWSPIEGVIGVKLVHHAGAVDPGPNFAISRDDRFTASVDERDDNVSIHSGHLTATVKRGAPWSLSFRAPSDADGEYDTAGRLVTGAGPKNLGYVRTDEGDAYTYAELSLGVGECVYGLGERFTAYVKNGQVVDTWNDDGGTASQFAYKSIPFYVTNRGYGVLVNHPGRVSFEVASEKVERVQFSVPGESLEFFVIHGPTQKEVLTRYASLTGRPALPPAWSFGLWLTTSFTTQYDEQTVMSFVDGMAERDVPLHVFHYDCFWMREFHWCDFVWDPAVFPDPPGMLERMHAKGLRSCVWINPYIAQRSHLFAEGAKRGFLLKRPNGDVWQWDEWQSGMGLVDFTNPDAYRWYQEKLGALIDMGVDAFKTDFGERIPTDVVYSDGSDPQRMHNYYALLYNRAVFEVLESRRGPGEACLFARSATVGSQQYPVHWGGDSTASYESMAETLRGGLSAGQSGIAFWSHDMGGFEDTASPDVYKRWCAFGLLSSHSRLHGSSSYRVPWLYDDEAVDVLRFFTRLKCRLMPYLFAAAVDAHATGVPMLRAMPIEFPDDAGCDYLDRQYMLGSSLLVAPVFDAGGHVQFYLPDGRWTHLIDGHALDGGRWHSERYDFLSLPIFVRPGAVIVTGSVDDRPDYDYAHKPTVVAYEPADGQSVEVVVPDTIGKPVASVTVSRSGLTVTASQSGFDGEWSFECVVDGVRSSATGTGAAIDLSVEGRR
ncbi:MAG: alpha-xylosidase [Spirochaetaceae bacterium]|nr:MAG: alpha-xylosidase [Spirochaetaceae bacterium]